MIWLVNLNYLNNLVNLHPALKINVGIERDSSYTTHNICNKRI